VSWAGVTIRVTRRVDQVLRVGSGPERPARGRVRGSDRASIPTAPEPPGESARRDIMSDQRRYEVNSCCILRREAEIHRVPCLGDVTEHDVPRHHVHRQVMRGEQ
jgi:hypothetical protein